MIEVTPIQYNFLCRYFGVQDKDGDRIISKGEEGGRRIATADYNGNQNGLVEQEELVTYYRRYYAPLPDALNVSDGPFFWPKKASFSAAQQHPHQVHEMLREDTVIKNVILAHEDWAIVFRKDGEENVPFETLKKIALAFFTVGRMKEEALSGNLTKHIIRAVNQLQLDHEIEGGGGGNKFGLETFGALTEEINTAATLWDKFPSE